MATKDAGLAEDDPQEDEDVLMTSNKSNTENTEEEEEELEKIYITSLFPFTAKVDGETFERMATQLQADLQNAKFSWKVKNVSTNGQFTRKEVDIIINLLFKKVFANAGMQRMLDFVTAYRESEEGEAPISAQTRAQTLSMDHEYSLRVREFFQSDDACLK